MSTFSPGPWRPVEPDLDHRPEMHVRSANDRMVAIVVQWEQQDYRADARLIAAAPEMHQLLKRYREYGPGEALGEDIDDLLARIDGDST